MAGKGSGWKGESRRHSLARKGVRTVPYRSQGKRQRYLKNNIGERVFTGKVAEQILMDLLKYDHEYWQEHYLGNSGYFKEGDMWTAWDNSTGELWTENFWMKENAISWATELGTTPTEMHNKDNKDVFRAIADEVREEEDIVYDKTTNLTNRIQRQIEELVDDYDDWYIGADFMNEVATILRQSRSEESELFRGDIPYITNIFVDKVRERFKESKLLKRSEYWKRL